MSTFVTFQYNELDLGLYQIKTVVTPHILLALRTLAKSLLTGINAALDHTDNTAPQCQIPF